MKEVTYNDDELAAFLHKNNADPKPRIIGTAAAYYSKKDRDILAIIIHENNSDMRQVFIPV